MSIAQFKKSVVENELYTLSENSLNLLHLLSESYDTIVARFNMVSLFPLAEKIAEVIGYDGGSPYASTEDYHGRLEIKDHELATELWHEDIFNAFNDIAPKGYFFGDNQGDYTWIGWFPYMEGEEEEING